MTKKSIGYVNMLWSCPRCTTRNPGAQRFCNGCGAPQPPDVAFEQAPEEKLLTDAAEIARAKAGPDLHCPYCNGRNPATAKFCGACGGDLAGSKVREAGKVVGAFRSSPAARVVCARCGTSNPAGSLKCAQCGASLAPGSAGGVQAAASATPATTRPARRAPAVLLIVLAVLCGVAALAVVLFASRKSETIGVVDSVNWERSVAIEALRAVEHEDWQDEIPSSANVGSCREQYRYTSQDPVANSVEICGTPYTVDTGSGYGEVVQDCAYEVYDYLCSYTIEEWSVVDTLATSGTYGAPAWPSLSLASDQRQGDVRESYSVVFATDDGRYTYTPDSAAEFSYFSIGSQWILEVSGFGSITGIEPAP
jgi:ribosomal protein L40E